MSNVGIFYGSTTGNTEAVANAIASKFDGAEVINIADADNSSFEKFELIVMGASTWGLGELQDDWIAFEDKLPDLDLKGKRVAIFGLGDQDGYPDSFVDAMGIIYEGIKDSGAELVGMTGTDGYSFDISKAIIDEKFIGLVIDDDNQSDLTDERINKWVSSLKNS